MKRTILFSVLLLTVVGLFVFASYEYKQAHPTKKPVAVVQVSLFKQVQDQAALKAKADAAVQAAQQQVITTLQAQKAGLCNTVKTLKVNYTLSLCQ